MTRLAIAIVLMMLLTGCLATLTTTSGSKNSTAFKNGLKKLEHSGDTSALKALSKDAGSSVWKDYSRSILKIYSSQDNKIKSLQNKNSSLSKENEKLQADLDKLNQINLELEKRSN